ncbi:6-phosphofructokinase [Ostreibacterium oceani]|uniref:6-phosphofructokinase n=1 Tax=Ostreibacterium oceani TaxID=2654998 RepID=UPI001C4032B5|nr:ATP-dependent 6-phosphofructokinase [Ostreibacterium oceani]
MKIGVVTGGGDCPGLNAVIRAVTRAAIYQHGWTVVGIPDAFGGLLSDNPSVIPLNMHTIRGILPQGGTILGTSNRADPFRFPIDGKDGNTDYADKSHLLKARLDEYGIDAIIMIGGDGTMRIAKRLKGMGIAVVGVPKTIDNDLYATDITFGHDSACNIAMEAIDRLHTTAYSHHRVMICEVMGRDAGWLALQSGVSGGADVILLPEIPYHDDFILESLAMRQKQQRQFSIIVVAEGAKAIDGQHSVVGQGHDAPRYGGIAHQLEQTLAPHLKQEIRAVVLGHLQRGGSPTHFDRVLGTRYGEFAIQQVNQQQFGTMVALRDGEIIGVTLEEATKKIKCITPSTNQLVATARNLGIHFGDRIDT